MALVERADPELVGIVGAGPLEMLVCDDESCLTWLEGQLRQSPPLREAMRHVWLAGAVSDEAFLRIEAAVGVRLDNPWRDAIEGRPPWSAP